MREALALTATEVSSTCCAAEVSRASHVGWMWGAQRARSFLESQSNPSASSPDLLNAVSSGSCRG